MLPFLFQDPENILHIYDTYIPIIFGLSVDTSHARRLPLLSPTNIHSKIG